MTEMINNLVFDLGLHKGEDTAFYLKKGFKVVSFEANPDLIEQCKRRFQSEILNKQLKLMEGAIAPASAGETITFYTSSVSVWGTTEANWVDRNTRLGATNQKVHVKRIDIIEAFQTCGIPYYLKIDIEGADIIALEALKLFPNRPQYVSIESEKVDFSKLKNELDLLRDLGYTKFKVVQQDDISGRLIKTQSLDGLTFEHVFEDHTSGPFGDDISGLWLTFEDAIKEYQRIFRLYHFFGDHSLLQKFPKIFRKISKHLYRRVTGHRGPLPGWYDVHASL